MIDLDTHIISIACVFAFAWLSGFMMGRAYMGKWEAYTRIAVAFLLRRSEVHGPMLNPVERGAVNHIIDDLNKAAGR